MVTQKFCVIISKHFGMWLSLVERTVRDGEVVGSNPVIPTMYEYRIRFRSGFFFSLQIFYVCHIDSGLTKCYKTE